VLLLTYVINSRNMVGIRNVQCTVHLVLVHEGIRIRTVAGAVAMAGPAAATD